MNQKIYYCELYAIYKNLLTRKQQNYYESYYYQDLSLSEISINFNVSRNAIYNQLQLITKKILNYEEKLNIYRKKQLILDSIKDQAIKSKVESLF